MQIVLLILKIIGIVLAVVLGIVLLLLCTFLFCPIRYRVDAACDGSLESIKVDASFSWLFRLIHGYVKLEQKTLEWQVRLAWKRLHTEEEPVSEELHQTEQNVKEAVLHEAEPIISREKDSFQEEVKETKGTEEANTVARNVESKRKRRKKQKRPPFWERMRCTYETICAKIKVLQKKKEKWEAFLTNEISQRALLRVKKEAMRLCRVLRPKKMEGSVHFGFEDPSLTGRILAVLGMFFAFYGEYIDVQPDFEEEVLEGSIRIRGGIRLYIAAVVAWNLILDRNVRITYKRFRRMTR